MPIQIHLGAIHVHIGGAGVDLGAVFGPQVPESPMLTKRITIGDGAFALVLEPQHNGRSVAVDGPATITMDPPDLFTVEPIDEAGLVWRFRDTGRQGTVTGAAVVDVRLGDERLEKVLEFQLVAGLPEADQLGGEFRDQVPDDVPAEQVEPAPLSG